jgi:ribonuclease D
MSFVFIDRPEDTAPLADSLAVGGPLALDCEAAGFHRYSDRLCLVQLTTADGVNYILDPLAFDVRDVLREPLEDPAVQVLMHGADYDLRLLDRDLSINLAGLVDTQAAAAILGERSLGLAALLESYLGIELQKKYQRADWAKRPLPDDMLAYAASDTRYLHALVGRLQEELARSERVGWAREEFRELEQVRWEGDGDQDPVTKVKGARDLRPRQVALLRAALEWRDAIARRLDRAPFRVASDSVLLDVVRQRPSDVHELGRMKGMNGRLAHAEGDDLLDRLAAVDARPADDIEGYPPRDGGNGRGRPPPEVEERMDRLKAVRNARADALDLARGTLLPNAALLEIAWAEPGTRNELRDVPGVKGWQVDAIGDDLLARLAGG